MAAPQPGLHYTLIAYMFEPLDSFSRVSGLARVMSDLHLGCHCALSLGLDYAVGIHD